MSKSNDSPDSEIPKGLRGGRAIAMTDLPPRIEFKRNVEADEKV